MLVSRAARDSQATTSTGFSAIIHMKETVATLMETLSLSLRLIKWIRRITCTYLNAVALDGELCTIHGCHKRTMSLDRGFCGTYRLKFASQMTQQESGRATQALSLPELQKSMDKEKTCVAQSSPDLWGGNLFSMYLCSSAVDTKLLLLQ